MKRLALALVPAVLLALAPAAPALAGPEGNGNDHGGRGKHGAPVLLALGDSVAAGVGAVPKVSGYPEQLRDLLGAGYSPRADKATPGRTSTFELINLAVSGATTRTLVRDQLDDAVALLEGRRADRDPKNDVEVVTVTIGGNDVFGPVTTTCLAPVPAIRAQCQATVTAQLEQVRTQLTATLSALTEAAGPRAEVVVTTYYNPIASCVLGAAVPAAVGLAEVVLEGGAVPGLLTVPAGLNDVIEGAAAATGAQVADLHGALTPAQLVGGADCLHPNLAGHTAIAGIVAGTLGE